MAVQRITSTRISTTATPTTERNVMTATQREIASTKQIARTKD